MTCALHINWPLVLYILFYRISYVHFLHRYIRHLHINHKQIARGRGGFILCLGETQYYIYALLEFLSSIHHARVEVKTVRIPYCISSS